MKNWKTTLGAIGILLAAAVFVISEVTGTVIEPVTEWTMVGGAASAVFGLWRAADGD